MLDGLPEVSAHFSRFRVVDVGLEASDQFDFAPMLRAADLLADARVHAIAWSGTSGGWRGIEHDARLCAQIRERTGVPATTSTLALLDAVAGNGDRAVGLVTPYPDDLHAVVVGTLAGAGIPITGSRNHSVTTSNWELSMIPAQALAAMVASLADAGPDAIAVYCTNLAAAQEVATWEAAYGVPVYDSVTLAVWGALRLAGVDTSRVAGWGSLFQRTC
jgi:maleate isomerase